MIRIRKKALVKVPDILLTKGKEATGLLIQRYEQGERHFHGKDFNSSIYGHEEVKQTLREVQLHKCAFCESIISHISYGDVEHFRPKAGWVQDDETIQKPGYYWLAYDWDNLLFCCELCNQRYKKNYFPLLDNTKRALSHTGNIEDEQPVFIHPANEEVEDFITFKEEIPIAVQGNRRGMETITKLALDREMLNEQRRKKLHLIKDLYDIVAIFPSVPVELKKEAVNKIRKYQLLSQNDGEEFAGMLRAFFRDNPIP
jgi:hypothetical protein